MERFTQAEKDQIERMSAEEFEELMEFVAGLNRQRENVPA
jgi:hypothetical protein